MPFLRRQDAENRLQGYPYDFTVRYRAGQNDTQSHYRKLRASSKDLDDGGQTSAHRCAFAVHNG
jgi:hypothetical protein